MGHFSVCRSFFSGFPGVYSPKRKINISMDDLIILKTCTCAGVCLCASESMQVLRSRLLYLHVWSEHLSLSRRRCETVRQAGTADALARETEHTFNPLPQRHQTLPKCLYLRGKAHTCTDRCCLRPFLFLIADCSVSPSFSLAHTNIPV